MGDFNLKRVNGPVLEAKPLNPWESRAVFNPGNIIEGENIHMLYRAVEGENFSTIGYAKLDIDGNILQRFNQPVIIREFDCEKQGCEDPRIVFFDDIFNIFYTGFDGENITMSANARVMLAQTEDFCLFTKKGMVGPDFQDKDAMIFPEKIDNKVVFMHRIIPNIQIAMFDSMEHLIQPEDDYWPEYLSDLKKYTLMYREFKWEATKIGAGPPPLHTDAGWLLIYHGVDAQRVYRAGAALIDEKNPYKVIARLPYPILEPATEYEKFGDVSMVVFPEGLVQIENEIFIYYGAADKVIALAAGSLPQLIDSLWKHKIH